MTKKAVLRKFALTLSGLFFLFFEIFPYIKRHHFLTWPWFVISILLGLAFFYTPGLIPIHRFWIILGNVLGAVNSRIILGFFYFLVLCPLSFINRFTSGDKMNRRYEPDEKTYRVNRGESIAKETMERMF